MKISIIAALGENYVLGKDNKLIWHMPSDLAYFKKKTMGHTVVMGRKTFNSCGNRALKGRKNIIISRNTKLQAEGITLVSSLNDAINKAAKESELFICGGAEIYKQALPIASYMYLTFIDHSFDGDTFFPEFPESKWEKVSSVSYQADDKNPYNYSFNEFKAI